MKAIPITNGGIYGTNSFAMCDKAMKFNVAFYNGGVDGYTKYNKKISNKIRTNHGSTIHPYHQAPAISNSTVHPKPHKFYAGYIPVLDIEDIWKYTMVQQMILEKTVVRQCFKVH